VGPDAPSTATVAVGGDRLTVATWGPGRPSIVLLHDGLGSIGQWQEVPSGLAARTGRTVLAYDRAGHGRSTPVPVGAWPADWLRREADVLAGLLDALDIEDPVLVGHSDGGSVAAIHGALTRNRSPLVLLAAHTWVEPDTADEIGRMRAAPDRIVAGLARHHAAPRALFEAWSGVWTSAEFARWDIRPQVAAIAAPVLVVQGGADEYASPEHAEVTARAIGDNAQCLLLDGLGHLLHHEAPDVVIDVVAGALADTRRSADR
jgi:pimeloyl-ACP methyl ester carboxylesterase